MSEREEGAGCVAGCLGWLLALPVMALLVAVDTVIGAWALRLLWTWFVVPAFGLAPLAFWVAAGLQLAYMALRGPVHTGIPNPDAGGAAIVKWFFHTVITRPLVLVGTGYVVHWLAVRP